MIVGNQLPILLISFQLQCYHVQARWESVTNPLDKLFNAVVSGAGMLGISYQSS